jgi:hypothetical protein
MSYTYPLIVSGSCEECNVEQPGSSDKSRSARASHAEPPETVPTVTNGTVATPPAPPVNGTKKAVHQWVDTANKLLQIAAIVVAGCWAWIGFQQTVAPGLEPKLGISSEVHWAPLQSVPSGKTTKTAEACQGSLQIKVNNPGKRAFDLAKVTIRGWLIPLDQQELQQQLAQRKILNLDWVREKVNPFYDSDLSYTHEKDGKTVDENDEDYVSRDLRDHYSEGVDNTASFEFIFPRDPRMIVAFYVDVEGTRPSSYWPFISHPVPTGNYTYQVDQLCGGDWDNHAKPIQQPKAEPPKSPTKP